MDQRNTAVLRPNHPQLMINRKLSENLKGLESYTISCRVSQLLIK
jgi:hypothetical protein